MLEVLMLAVLAQIPCTPGQVLDVNRGRDYTLNICGVGVVALRGVEPPLAVAEGYPPLGSHPASIQTCRFRETFSVGRTSVHKRCNSCEGYSPGTV